jgi:hypothetical protein
MPQSRNTGPAFLDPTHPGFPAKRMADSHIQNSSRRSQKQSAQATRHFWTPRTTAATFSPDQYGANPLAGHPPLYYLLMVLPYRLTADWSPGATLLTLRLASVFMAAGSFFFLWRSIRLLSDSNVRRWTLGNAVVLCYFPSLF